MPQSYSSDSSKVEPNPRPVGLHAVLFPPHRDLLTEATEMLSRIPHVTVSVTMLCIHLHPHTCVPLPASSSGAYDLKEDIEGFSG